MPEKEISLFPTLVASLSTLKLSTVGYQIFEKFQTAGSLFSYSMCLPPYKSSGWPKCSLPSVLPQNCPPPCSSSLLLVQLVMMMVVDVAGMKNHTAAMQQGAHIMEALASRKD